jgi:hypothetical protein
VSESPSESLAVTERVVLEPSFREAGDALTRLTAGRALAGTVKERGAERVELPSAS